MRDHPTTAILEVNFHQCMWLKSKPQFAMPSALHVFIQLRKMRQPFFYGRLRHEAPDVHGPLLPKAPHSADGLCLEGPRLCSRAGEHGMQEEDVRGHCQVCAAGRIL
mmetsp:Transcript_99349/g.182245  ORF Transcript_99349/g.182245 Transcript_99349/m.182245 type:complete len:107 (-) Transcript_99349:305-625(-)